MDDVLSAGVEEDKCNEEYGDIRFSDTVLNDVTQISVAAL